MTTPLSIGDLVLGKYRVERVLGRGGMGVVVAARHIDLGELFAIKLMLPEAEAHPEAVGRFLREARAAARLRGEHVARVVDVGRLESGLPYMVMEHLTGSDLGALVEARGPLPVDEAVLYMMQACEGISEAHAAGIIHRDLKPANLFLIRRPNGTPCVKVLDFGIAKSVDAENVSLTATSSVMGSPHYMSPEQMMRSKSVDVRADVWSMGVVFYELLTGTVPFQGETFTEIVARVLQEEAPRASLARAELSPAVDALIAACLHKDLPQRIQSIDQLRAALAALGAPAGPSIVVRSDPSSPRPSLNDDVLSARGSLPTSLKPTFQGSSVDASPAPRSRRGPLVLGLAGGAVALAAGVFWWSRAPSGAALSAGEPPRAEAAVAPSGAPSSAVEPTSLEPAVLPTPSAAPTAEAQASAAPASASAAPPTAARPTPTPAAAKGAPPSTSPPRAPPSASPPKTQATASPSTPTPTPSPTPKRGGIF